MKIFKADIVRRREKGFTVIEAVVSLLIVSIISLGATMSNAQLMSQTSRNDSFLTAERQALNALHWITTDIQMAQTIQPGGAAGFPLTLEWIEWDNTDSQVIYTLANNSLRRSISVDESAALETLVASFINDEDDMTCCSSYNGVLTIKITSSLTRGGKTIDVTKVNKITSRPNL
jgi:type II secretory pathway pseudopilin PulG